jgi:hypothetical protein
MNNNEVTRYKEEFEGEESLSKEAQELLNSKNIASDDETYPYKNINIGRDNLSAFQLYRKFKNGIIKLDPEFQREGNIWTPKQKSELIESILIGIPLPILYLKEDKEGNWILIDGRQRLSAIFDFMDNKFALSNLTILKQLNSYQFKENEERRFDKTNLVLNTSDRGKIEDVNLILHIIKEPTPEKLTYDLFDRVNRGGTRLNNQEMRNAIYQGSATSFLKTLSRLSSFKLATSNISSSRMKDRYLVLRFISFYLWKKNISKDIDSKESSNIEYKSDLEDFLAKSMIFLNTLRFKISLNNFDDLSLDKQNLDLFTQKNEKIKIEEANDLYLKLLYSFNTSMINIYDSFQGNSFRLPKKEGGVIRPINMALFEVITYFFIELEHEFKDNKNLIINEYNKLINNVDFHDTKREEDDFIKSLTYTVDSNKSVFRRFGIIDRKIKLIKDNVKYNKNKRF